MFKTNLKPQHKVGEIKKAMRFGALAFFLSFATVSTQAQSNVVAGAAYGTNDLSDATAITSVADGVGTLSVGYAGTTNVALDHDIIGFIVITNHAPDFTIASTPNAAIKSSDGPALAVINATNLTVSGGRFLGTADTGGGKYPPIPGADETALGGLLQNSTATIDGSEFAGSAGNAALVVQSSDLTINDGIFRGGAGATGGSGLVAVSNSLITINSGSFTGQVGSTAFYLQNSDATVYSGNFVGNLYGRSRIAGDGLFSQQTTAATNSVALYGGSFSTLAFYGVDGSVQNFLAGTNLVVQYGIIQNNGTVVVENLSDSALQDITILDGIMEMQNAFTLSSNGVFSLLTADSRANFAADLMLETGSALSNGLGHVDVAGSFTQSSDSDLFFIIGAETNGMLSANNASFETNANLQIDATQASFYTGSTQVVLIVTSAGITGTNNLIVDASTFGRIIYNGLTLIGGNNLAAGFSAAALKDYWNATGQLGMLAEELDANGNASLLNNIDAYNDPDRSSAAIEQTYFTTFNNFQTALQGMRASVGESISRSSDFREALKLMPPGAKGPERNNQLRGWAKYYGHFFTHDEDQLNPSYDTVLQGGVAGIDTSIGNLLVGISGGSGHYRTSYDVKAKADTVAYHGSLYGTYGTDRGYIDAAIAYGQNQVDTRTADPFRLEGSFNADLISAYLGGGYDLVDLQGKTIFTPEAMIQYTTYKQDAYTEEGTAAVPRVIDAFDSDSMLGGLGMNVSMLNKQEFDTFAYKADLRMHWMHEFNPDPSNMNFSLQGGTESYQIALPSLDEDLFRIGIGATFFNTLQNQPKNVLLRIDFDELFGDGFNSHNLSAKVVYAF